MEKPAKLLLLVLAGALCASIRVVRVSAQNQVDQKPTIEQEATKLPPGTTICAEFTKSLDAKKLKVGDPVEARTTLAVLSRGQVVIPEGSLILGRVTQAVERTDKTNRSVIGILFNEVDLKGSGDARLRLTVQAIGERPLTMQASPPDVGPMMDPNRVPVNLGPRTVTAPQMAPAPMSMPPTGPKTGDDMGSRNPILDASSKGAYGFPGVFLVESRDPAKGSRIISHKGNVRIGDGSEVILRVIVAPPKDFFLP
ncbi:MAG TPA: hypothetical protein VJR23_12620 [Candidatus Acidoferrales bacterium]|nr:hypothetical protein [Candidatus Acidoferrales bacterium]